ncbi:uncharacterized protein LOC134824628 [Bolinopsis microptera]|uniref:uncharacterized protein LOC134824628 n=1 Tax=Bolinopsis microptera TaxID=2820187 RepID=UPI0030795620
MSDVRRFCTDLTRLPSPVYKPINTNQGVYARAVLKENAKFMLVMENGSKEGKDQNIKRAFSAQPGKHRGVRPMHMSTLCLEHDNPPLAEVPSYSRHFNSKKGLRPAARSSQYPSQFISQISLEHSPKGKIECSENTTNKSTFQHWPEPHVRSCSRERNKENMRSGVDGAEVVYETLFPTMYSSTYDKSFHQ